MRSFSRWRPRMLRPQWSKQRLRRRRTVRLKSADLEKFHLDELVARVLEYDKDPRKVVTDADARYSGVKLSENSLIPGNDAKLGSTRFDWWLENVAPPPKK